MANQNRYSGKIILVVEDDYFIAQHLVGALEELGALIVGPAPSVDRALKLTSGSHHIDAAILDINLNGELVYPVADALLAKSVPFVFATGYDDRDIPLRYRSVPCLPKPVDGRALQQMWFGS